MNALLRSRGLTLGRLIVIAVLAALAWCVLSLFASTSSASADENGGGLLGVVGQTVSGTGEVLGGVTDAAEPVVSTVVDVVAPVAEPLPAPVAEPVGQVVDTVVTTADQTVAAVDSVAVTAVDTTLNTVADVADAGLVGQVVTPVVDLVESVPVVGAIVEGTGAGGLLTGTAGAVDSTVGTVVGTPGPSVGSIVPELPLSGVDEVVDILDPSTSTGSGSELPVLPGIPLPVVPSVLPVTDIPVATASAAALSSSPSRGSSGSPAGHGARFAAPEGTGASVSSYTSPADSGPSLGGAPGGFLGAAGSANAAAGASGPAAGLAHEDGHGSIYSFTTLRSATDDDLPGAPVFDSDVSPD